MRSFLTHIAFVGLAAALMILPASLLAADHPSTTPNPAQHQANPAQPAMHAQQTPTTPSTPSTNAGANANQSWWSNMYGQHGQFGQFGQPGQYGQFPQSYYGQYGSSWMGYPYQSGYGSYPGYGMGYWGWNQPYYQGYQPQFGWQYSGYGMNPQFGQFSSQFSQAPNFPPIRVGDKVEPSRSNVQLWLGQQTLGMIPQGEQLTVEDVRSPWIGVTAQISGRSVRGWVHASEIQDLSLASRQPHPTQR